MTTPDKSLPEVTVYGFSPLHGWPDLSPFVTKVVIYLKYRKWPYVLKSGDVRKAPRGKLPFVEVQGRKITDSDQIITELEKLHPEPLGLDQSDLAKGTGKATQSMLEHHFYFLAVYDRWSDPGCWQQLKPLIQSYLGQHGVPRLATAIVAGIVRKQVVGSTKTQGVGRLGLTERMAHVNSILDSLETQLQGRPYFGGDKPDRVDFTAVGMLGGYSIEKLDSPVAFAIRERKLIMDYLGRMSNLM